MTDAGTGTLLPAASGAAVTAQLWARLRGRRVALAGILGVFGLEAALTLVFPIVLGTMIDAVLEARGIPAAFPALVALLLTGAAGAGVLTWAGGRLLARLVETVIAELREDYLTAALALPRGTVEAAGTGDLVTRASDDIAQISNSLPGVLTRVCSASFVLVLAVLGLGALDWRFLLAFALVLPLHALILRWYLRTAPPIYAAERATESLRGQRILGTLTQLPTVTAHGLQREQLEGAGAATWQGVRWAMRARIVQNRLFGRLNAVQGIGLLGVLGAGSWLASAGQATPGQVASATLLFLATVAPLEGLLFVLDEFQSALASLARLTGVIDAAGGPDARDDPEARGDPGMHRADPVSIRGLGFGYHRDHPVLSGIDLDVAAGERVAIVGATGSGKSTLVSLVAGVHRPAAGVIVRHVPTTRIATVTQETHVFAATLRDNLTLARPDATDEQLRDALAATGAAGLSAVSPDGLDTPIGHGGHPLSALQAQQLALVRLFLSDAGLVMLDEATADADSADAGVLERTALAAIRRRPAIVVAHRLSQASACDRILVMAAGRIVEQGSHEELLALDGSYARLWRAWSRPRS